MHNDKRSVTVYISLGSNLNRPLLQVKQAIINLQEIVEVVQVSSFYYSKPLGPQDQPDFINAIVEAKTFLAPLDLLNALQKIEEKQGRVRERIWGPRTIDLDILLYGNEIIDEARLIVPHPGIFKREFWLYPLSEIAPELILPTGESILELKHQCPENNLELIEETTE